MKQRRQARDRRLLTQQLTQLMQSAELEQLQQYIQHGQTSCFEHSLGVAYYSLALANLLHLPCNRKSMVVGALLHDYFLYDWHGVKLKEWHGYRHPGIACKNAKQAVPLTPRECNVIERHMFPLTLTPPKYREAMLVCLADKYCTLREMMVKNPYQHITVNCATDETVLA